MCFVSNKKMPSTKGRRRKIQLAVAPNTRSKQGVYNMVTTANLICPARLEGKETGQNLFQNPLYDCNRRNQDPSRYLVPPALPGESRQLLNTSLDKDFVKQIKRRAPSLYSSLPCGRGLGRGSEQGSSYKLLSFR